MDRIGMARDFLRRRGVHLMVEASVNFLLPLGVYDLVEPRRGQVQALIASSLPPTVWSLVEFARRRRVDAVSLLVLGGIALSLLAFLGGGGVKMLQLRYATMGGLGLWTFWFSRRRRLLGRARRTAVGQP